VRPTLVVAKVQVGREKQGSGNKLEGGTRVRVANTPTAATGGLRKRERKEATRPGGSKKKEGGV